ncbi:MAG: hypothetical protein AUK44_03080 [Porphyromonadaceae bacterium CG2_30_38_12]|nr:MAG: hypothetical protein AUK44_03080 [Porphyromonadaceae bacterium CG2_30_38_12]
MWQLNLPLYDFRIKTQNNKTYIWDSQRKKFVLCTPEEWVRQNFIRYLIEEKKYPAGYIAIEQQLNLNGMNKRCDAVIYNEQAEALVIVELKAPSVKITQQTFDQAAVYNSKLKVSYLIISNGLTHYCCWVDSIHSKYIFHQEIPDYTTL